MDKPNVLPLFDPPRQKSYRAAVAKIIRDLKSRHSLTNQVLGEAIGICAETVSNAENENNDLSPVTLLRIAYEFGEESIKPARDLYLRRYETPQTLTQRFDEAWTTLEVIRREISA